MPTGSFIVQAPAGSGKTSLLTLRYLRLLATSSSPEQIVAITFTRKAAAEMRHRIVAALALARGAACRGCRRAHVAELHAHAAAALARSRERGWGLEHNPARLHVQTIDGLNHWLARRLPLAARIGLSATLVDDARPLYAEAARRTGRHARGRRSAGRRRLERLARALNHEPRQLAELIDGMLGTRELWLPKLLCGEPDRSACARRSTGCCARRWRRNSRGARGASQASTGSRCSRSAARRPRPARRRVRARASRLRGLAAGDRGRRAAMACASPTCC